MFELIIASQAQRELRKIRKLYRDTLLTTLKEIKEDPFLGKPLSEELVGSFSARVGVFRILYKVNKKDKKVYIISVGHRSKVYQQ